jgi:predicted alpha/beta hydrolase family esterase
MAGSAGPHILVGHSVGSATIPLAAARAQVDRLVFVAAIVPAPGKSIYETIGPATRAAMEHVTIDNGDGTRSFDFDAPLRAGSA